MKNKTQLMDLNIDVQLLILEEMDLLDLISVSETNPHFSSLAEDVFRRKNAKKLFKIIDPLFGSFQNLIETNKTIYIRQFSVILRLLKQFGHLISRLVIIYGTTSKLAMNVVSINTISEAINLHCSKTLTHFEVFNYHNSFFDSMMKPFEKIEFLLIRGLFNNLGSDTLTFAELFPAMRQLILEYVEVQDTSCIDQKFPHMEKFHIEISRYNNSNRFAENEVLKLLTKNPQIRSLKLSKSSRAFLITVNQILPKLESLELVNYFPFNNESNKRIVFENVKNFSIEGSSESAPKNFEFKKLNEFHTENLPLLYNKWVELVKKSPYLQKLYVEKVDDENLLKLAKIDSNVTEVQFNLKLDVSDQAIVAFVTKFENTKKIHFIRDKMPDTFDNVAEILKQQSGDKWTIKETHISLLLECI